MQKTYLGQTAGGIIKTAEIAQMRAGNWEIVVRTADGEVQGVVVQLPMSDAAYQKMQNLQEEIEAQYAEEQRHG